MPGGDRRGPRGFGPMTGRRAGYCAGFNGPGFTNPIGGWQRFGYGFRGGGRGWRTLYHATGMPGWQRAGMIPPAQPEDPEILKEQANWLQSQLEAVKKRIEELE